jgi:hypothetical protein
MALLRTVPLTIQKKTRTKKTKKMKSDKRSVLM